MSPAEKRATWRRITQEGTAWRFNRYAERALPGEAEAAGAAEPAARARFMTRPRLQESALRLFPLAWPVFVGQIAVLAFSTVDTVMTARASALDLAALAIGGSVYISVFVGLMGVILAVGPIAGQLFGAGKHRESGHEAEQAVWLALGALGRSAARCCSCPSPSSRWRRPSRRSPRRCAATCAASPAPCPPRWCSWPTAASTSPSRGRRR